MNQIEVPGQYTGESRPLVHTHAKIVTIDQTVFVFNTLRSPIKMSLHGSDGKIHTFVVKFGEDLRQDQRVQQLLALMSKQLATDRNCRQNNLSIVGFKVIPFDPHYGLIEFVENHEPINSLIEKSAERSIQNFSVHLNAVQQDYIQFLEDNTERQMESNESLYGSAALKHSQKRVSFVFSRPSAIIWYKSDFLAACRHV